MRHFTPLAAIVIAVVLTLPGIATAQDLTYSQDFENGLGDVASMSQIALLTITNQADEVHSGAAAAKLSYPPSLADLGQMPAVIIQGLNGGFGGFRMQVKATQQTPLVCLLSEADGSRYTSVATVPGGEWVEVTFDAGLFFPDKDAPDENGKLDQDQVIVVGFCDMTFLIRQMIPAGAPAGGERILCFDDLEILSKSTEALEEVDGEILLDTFDGPAARAVLAGDGSLGIESREDDPGNTALYAKYTISQGTPMAGILKPIPQLEGRVPVAIRFDIKTDYLGTVVVGSDENDGSSYYCILNPAPTDEWQTMEIPLTALSLSDDSFDENGRLDTESMGAIMFGDASGMAQMFGVNGLWIDNLVLVLGE